MPTDTTTTTENGVENVSDEEWEASILPPLTYEEIAQRSSTEEVFRRIAHSTKAYMHWYFESDTFQKEHLVAHMTELVERLTEAEDTPVIKMLVENVVMMWTLYQKIQRQYAIEMRNGLSFSAARFWEDRLTKSHDRYLKAVRELNQARKMLRPMQINTVGMTQVNIGK